MRLGGARLLARSTQYQSCHEPRSLSVRCHPHSSWKGAVWRRASWPLATPTVDNVIDLFEVNEAFAAVVLKFIKELALRDCHAINVNGGAIALGHPLGATGAMLVGTALDELERRGQRRALVTLCAGGGMGIATVLERVG
jgi:acetyl-CoA C-acetyltransferase